MPRTFHLAGLTALTLTVLLAPPASACRDCCRPRYVEPVFFRCPPPCPPRLVIVRRYPEPRWIERDCRPYRVARRVWNEEPCEERVIRRRVVMVEKVEPPEPEARVEVVPPTPRPQPAAAPRTKVSPARIERRPAK